MITVGASMGQMDRAEVKRIVQSAKAAGLISVAAPAAKSALVHEMPSNLQQVEQTGLIEIRQKFDEFIAAFERLKNTLAQVGFGNSRPTQFFFAAPTPAKHQEVDRIMRVVAEYFNFSVAALLSRERSENYVVPRHIAIVLCLQLTNLSQVQIGIRFHRDHGTVMHAKKSLEARMASDRDLAETFALLKARAMEAVKNNL